MKLRLFFILFVYSSLTVLFVAVITIIFFNLQRNKLYDNQLEAFASSILASNISPEFIDKIDKMDSFIQNILGEEQTDLIVKIYSKSGKLLLENSSETPVIVPLKNINGTFDIETDFRNLRFLQITHKNIIIQIGLEKDPLWSELDISKSILLSLITTVFILLLITSFLVSELIFIPIQNLSKEIINLTNDLNTNLWKPTFLFETNNIFHSSNKPFKYANDPFVLLCQNISHFVSQLNKQIKNYHFQMAVLSHELKTPLMIIKGYLDKIQNQSNITDVTSFSIKANVILNDMIIFLKSYLEWVNLSVDQHQNIFAIKIQNEVKSIVDEYNELQSNRILLNLKYDFTVFCDPIHFKQLIRNLVSNSLNYSDSNSQVNIIAFENKITISDSGPGIPENVLSSIGQPFNKGNNIYYQNSNRSGLGLAWATAICQKYKWELNVKSNESGTSITIHF